MAKQSPIYTYEQTIDDIPDWILEQSYQDALDKMVEESQLEFIRKQQIEREIIEQQNREYEAAVEADRKRLEAERQALMESGTILHLAVTKIDGNITVVDINSHETLDALFRLVDNSCTRIKIGRITIERCHETLVSLGVCDRQLLRLID